MRQLLLWNKEEGDSGPIEVEGSVRQELTALMAEALVVVIQARKEEGDEHEYVEES